MLYSGTDPKSYITEHTLVYEGNRLRRRVGAPQIAPISAGMATQQANLQLVNRVKRLVVMSQPGNKVVRGCPLTNEYGTYKTVTARS
jgi:hypothetical protein